VPLPAGLRFQAVHTDDAAEAYRQAIVRDVRGAFNVAADDPIDAEVIAGLLDARAIVVPPRLARSAVAGLWHLRLQPTAPGWLDLALSVPLMSCARARTELEWSPSRRGADALAAVLGGLRDGANGATPPLAATTSGPRRLREIASGVGTKEG